MKPEKQREAIANECGWKSHDHPDCMAKKEGWTMPEKWCMRPDGELVFNHDRTDYLKDLNAIVAEVRTLPQKRIAKTLEFLQIIVTNDPSNLSNEKALATAEQWSEAFLRGVGRWEE